MSDGLRARFRQRRTQSSGGVELGASSANAYFTSKRLRQRVPRKAKPPPLKERQALKQKQQVEEEKQRKLAKQKEQKDEKQREGEGEGNGDEEEEEEEEEEESKGLKLPPRGQLLLALREVDDHVKPQSRRFEQHFPSWKSELLAGYNLLFYGVGSKLSLLQEFASSWLGDGIVLQVHGYLPIVSLRYLAKLIQEQILRVDVKLDQSLSQQCRDLAKAKPLRRIPHIYLLVHSIDGLALRTPEAQTCLSWLAKSPFIALVASMDHVNGPSIWKEEDSLRFEWLSQNLDTCEPYTNEIEFRLAKRAKTADPTSSGVKFILQSLTPTDVATLQELARQQLDAGHAGKSRKRKLNEMQLAPYQSVYEACRRKLLHTTPLAMKNSIKCLEDHGLLKQSRVNTVEYLQIPLPEVIIKVDILQLENQD
ncbi:Origin recognition complex subunit 2 [Phytophthora boehmeriae]|uniref:Origin recognition complex subunit 2 n=1 Tax=Phytophthora boehmeriae TaxID=109152 RepID=A0A8T1WGD9_9STRA|nr:Origin recognition complex subunit 2 [Phytophthora boehmeriae]